MTLIADPFYQYLDTDFDNNERTVPSDIPLGTDPGDRHHAALGAFDIHTCATSIRYYTTGDFGSHWSEHVSDLSFSTFRIDIQGLNWTGT